MECIRGLRHYFFIYFFRALFWGEGSLSRFFRELFFSRPTPPMQSPWGTTPPCSPPGGLHPPVGRFFFSIFFSQKYFFILKNRHMGDFFGQKHGSVEVSGTQTMPSPNFEKKVRKSRPPKDGPAGGISALFFENRRQHGLGR